MSLAAEQIRLDRVAIYIRWSTEDQGEGTTLDVQTEACKAFIISQGWKFREELIFVDDGVSGAAMDRPALKKLRALVQRREVDCVVVYKLDRLSRSVLDMLKLVMEEWDGRCAVKSAREPIDTMTPTGKMFFYQLMSFAEWERSVIRDRMFSGRLRRAQEGKSPGFPMPFGYTRVSGGPILQDPAAAPVVRRIYQLYLAGHGYRMIAKLLDHEGAPTPTGGKWVEGSVLRILTNPAYMGRLVFGKTRRIKGKVVNAKEPHVVKDGVFPAIINRDEWEAVEQVRAGRSAPGREEASGRAHSSDHLLTGLLKCSCGRSVTGIAFSTRGSEYRYYICSGAQATGNHVCPCGNIKQPDLDDVVVGKLLTLFRTPEAKRRLVEQLTVEVKAVHERCAASLQAAEAEVRRLEESEKRLKRMLLDDRLTVEEYRQLQGELNEQLAEARGALRGSRKAEEGAREALNRDTQSTLLYDRIDEWEVLTVTERKQLLRQFVSQVTVFRDKKTDAITCEICWKWAPVEGAESGPEVWTPDRDYSRIKEFAAGRQRVGGRFVAES